MWHSLLCVSERGIEFRDPETWPLVFREDVRGLWFVNGDGERVGIVLAHRSTRIVNDWKAPGWCFGSLTFEPHGRGGRAQWKVESLDPLTLSPSVLCKHDGEDFHGYIRDGLWVPA